VSTLAFRVQEVFAPGISWYLLVLLGSLAVAVVLAFVMARQGRSFRK